MQAADSKNKGALGTVIFDKALAAGTITLSGASLGTYASPAPQILLLVMPRPAGSTLFPYTTLFRSTAGNIFVSSDAVLRVKDITTQAATANTVDIRTTTGKALSFEKIGRAQV